MLWKRPKSAWLGLGVVRHGKGPMRAGVQAHETDGVPVTQEQHHAAGQAVAVWHARRHRVGLRHRRSGLRRLRPLSE